MADPSPSADRPGALALGTRLVVSVVFLALAGIAATVLLIASGAMEPDQLSGDWAFGHQLLVQVAEQPWLTRGLTVVGTAVGGLICFAVIIRQWTSARASSFFHLLDADDRGFVVVDSRGIAVVAEQAAMSAHGVIAAEATIKGSGTSPIRVRLRIQLYPGANIKRAGTQVREAVARAIDELVGLEVQDVTVSAHISETDAMIRVLA